MVLLQDLPGLDPPAYAGLNPVHQCPSPSSCLSSAVACNLLASQGPAAAVLQGQELGEWSQLPQVVAAPAWYCASIFLPERPRRVIGSGQASGKY